MKKLTVKTFLLLLGLSLTVILFAYGCIRLFLPYANENSARRSLEESTQQLADKLRETPRNDSEPLFVDFIRTTGADVCLLNKEGVRISLFTFEETGGEALFGEQYPFRFSDSLEDYMLVTRYHPARSEALLAAISKTVPLVLAVAIILSCASAFFFSNYMTRPILRIGRIADRIANLDFSWYCPDIREDEIGSLSKSINELSDKLHRALDEINDRNAALEHEIALEKERERRQLLFFSSVSHELKTPVATVIGQIEGMQANIGVYKDRDKYLARSREILQSLNNFIREILLASHIDVKAQTAAGPVCLSGIVKDLVHENAAYAELSMLSVESRIEEGVFVYGDETFLKKALGNVLANAVAYSPEEGSVTVELTAKDCHTANLVITNAPAHIEEKALPHVFEAFYRAALSDGHGSGLGLYITKMILDAYNVTCLLENTADGVRFEAIFYTQKTP